MAHSRPTSFTIPFRLDHRLGMLRSTQCVPWTSFPVSTSIQCQSNSPPTCFPPFLLHGTQFVSVYLFPVKAKSGLVVGGFCSPCLCVPVAVCACGHVGWLVVLFLLLFSFGYKILCSADFGESFSNKQHCE